LTISRRSAVASLATVVSLVAAPLCAVLAADAAAASWRVIGRASSSGDFAVAAASGSVDNPNQIAVNVSARGASGFAVVACSKGIGSIGSKSTQFSGAGTHTLKLPMRNPDSCDVTASGSGSGRVVVKILAR
jgi:hypothetical protein